MTHENAGKISGGDKLILLLVALSASSIKDIGLTHKQSSAFQQIASIPEEDFESFIEEKKEAVNKATAELTIMGFTLSFVHD